MPLVFRVEGNAIDQPALLTFRLEFFLFQRRMLRFCMEAKLSLRISFSSPKPLRLAGDS